MTDELKTCRHCEAIIPEGRRFCDAHYQLELKMYEKEIAEYERAYQTYLDELAAWEALPQKDKDDIAAANVAKQKAEFLQNSELEDKGFQRLMRVVGGGLWLALKLSLAWFVINMIAALANLYGFVAAGVYIGTGWVVIVPVSFCIALWKESTGRNKRYTSFNPYLDEGRPSEPYKPSIPAP